jgi:hypothetical protein
MASGGRLINDELDRIWKEAAGRMAAEQWIQKHLEGSSPVIMKVLSQHLLGGTKETMKNLSQDRLCLNWDSNQAPSKYKSRALPLGQQVYLLLLHEAYHKSKIHLWLLYNLLSRWDRSFKIL